MSRKTPTKTAVKPSTHLRRTVSVGFSVGVLVGTLVGVLVESLTISRGVLVGLPGNPL